MTGKLRRLITLVLLGVMLPAFAAMTQVRSFNLQHRTADELIPVLRPLVDDEGAISGSGQVLVIRSTLQNLAELEPAIKDLDTARRQLMITVRQGARERTVRRGGSVSGEFGDDDVSVEVGKGGPGASVRIYSTNGRRDDRIAQRLRVSEGGWAQIRAGEAVPIPEQTVTAGPGGTTVQQSIEYRDVQSGFEVRPRLIGDDRVAVDIRPFRQRRSPSGGGVIEQQEIVTTTEGKLGEWIALGGGIDTRRDRRHGTIYSTQEKDKITRQVFLRVDTIDQRGGD